AYYALPPELSTEDGTVTNALHGFVSMLSSLIRDQKPRALVVAFDLPGGTFRDAIADDYKGGRGETPEDLPPQFDMIREVLAALAIPVISREGFEADDVIATLATRSRDEKMPVIVVTGDRDTYQLVEDPFIRVLYNKRGVSDYALYDEAGILERTGVHPVDYFDNLLANANGFTPKLKENILAAVDRVRVNLQVMPLVRDVELEANAADFPLGGWDPEVAQATFERFELNSLWNRVSGLMAKGLLGVPSRVSLAGTKLPEAADTQKVNAALAKVPLPKAVAAPVAKRSVLKADAEQFKAVLGGLDEALVAISGGEDAQLGILAPGQAGGYLTGLSDGLGLLSTTQQLNLSGLNLKPLLKMLVDAGWEHPNASFDAALAAYLIDPDRGSYDRETVAEIAGIALAVDRDEGETEGLELARELDLVEAVTSPLRAQLAALGMATLFDEIEMPLVLVLARMESRGIRVNRKALAALAESLTSQVAELEQMVYEFAGKEFNLNSPAQLRELLFVDLGLSPLRKTKTGFSTDAKTLERLREEHPIIPAMLEYREYEKLRSTYGSNLLDQVGEDERIHATFRQTVARTGRLSSEAPNLHNIPVRSRLGAQFRELFIPQAGWELLAADYDQIELRVIAHLSGDPGLISAFNSAEDVHRQVASQVFGVPAAKVSKAQREKAKVVSYGLAYGMEAFGLSQRMQTSPEEAKDIVNGYFA
ncbi:MAG: DNA polymerase, partial [Actinobacteria bacterium]|nr:DNA polymerase [Actinomycetota bacterium]